MPEQTHQPAQPQPTSTHPTHLHEALHASLQRHRDELHACAPLAQQLLILHLQGQILVVRCEAVTCVAACAHHTHIAIRVLVHVLLQAGAPSKHTREIRLVGYRHHCQHNPGQQGVERKLSRCPVSIQQQLPQSRPAQHTVLMCFLSQPPSHSLNPRLTAHSHRFMECRLHVLVSTLMQSDTTCHLKHVGMITDSVKCTPTYVAACI